MKYLPAVIYHLLPLIPLAFGFPFLAVATALLVGLAYIKVHKLKQTEIEDGRKGRKADPGLTKAIVFWERLTFLKRSKADDDNAE